MNLDYTIHFGAQWNNDHSCVAFVAAKKAFRSAEGISRFPDGGIPDYLLVDVSLYMFNDQTQEINQLINYNDLTDWIGASRGRWHVNLAFMDSVIHYRIQPGLEWTWIIRQAKTAADSSRYYSLKEKYRKAYSLNININKVSELDTTEFIHLYQRVKESNKADLTDLNKRVDTIPLENLGLVIQDIYPKPDDAYIEETIYLLNPSFTTRRAIIEQIISKLSKEEIKDLLINMDDYKNSLEGYEKSKYELYSKETYEKIRGLL